MNSLSALLMAKSRSWLDLVLKVVRGLKSPIPKGSLMELSPLLAENTFTPAGETESGKENAY